MTNPQTAEICHEMTYVLTTSTNEKSLCKNFTDVARQLVKLNAVKVYRFLSEQPPGNTINCPANFALIDIDHNQTRLTLDQIKGSQEALAKGFYEQIEPDGLLTRRIPIKDINGTRLLVCLDGLEDTPDNQANLTMLLAIFTNLLFLISRGERDALTGLLNRQAFEREFANMQQAISVSGRRCKDERNLEAILALIDIDYFKRVNDTYGHLYGDEVILSLARELLASFRHSDFCFRFGGEEFAIILTDTLHDHSATVFERLRKKIANNFFPQIGGITISIGYTRICADATISQIINRADQALYHCKMNGRNQIQSWEYLISQGVLANEKLPHDEKVEMF